MTATIGRCRDCKYYSASLNKYLDDSCSLFDTKSAKPTHPDNHGIASAQDYESYRAYLKVSPDFGCVAFVAKEKA